jgi:bis(5'-adenosyl)-triphosphatase
MSSDCPFCLSDDSQMYFMKNEFFKALYNKSPILPGHSLIVPNRHVERFEQLNDNELQNMLLFTKAVVNRLNSVFPSTGFDWTIQDGCSAGQTVKHFHIHLIPRKDGDLPDPGDWYPLLESENNPYLDSDSRSKLSDDQLIRINQKLKEIE